MDQKALIIWGLTVWLAILSQESTAAVYRGKYSQEDISDYSLSPSADRQEGSLPDSGLQRPQEKGPESSTSDRKTHDKFIENIADDTNKQKNNKDKTNSPKNEAIEEAEVTEDVENGTEEEDENGIIHGRYSYIDEDGIPATIEYEAGPGMRFVVKNYIKGSTALPVPVLVGRSLVGGADKNQRIKILREAYQVTEDEGSLGTNDRITKENSWINTSKTARELANFANNLTEHSTKDAETDPSQVSMSEFVEDGTEEEDKYGIIRGKYSYIEKDGVPAKIEYEAGPGMKFVIKNYIKGSKILPVPDITEDPESEREVTAGNTEGKKEINSEQNVYIPKVNLENLKSTSTVLIEKDPEYEHASVIAKHDSKKLTRKTRTINYQDENLKPALSEVSEIKAEDNKSNKTQEENNEASVDASYKFGFAADGQTRNEEADAQGNVQGSYSYIGDDGMLTKVEYEAGSGKGFIIKRIVQEDTRSLGDAPQSQQHINLGQTTAKLNSKVEIPSPTPSAHVEVSYEDHKIQSPIFKAPIIVNKEQNDGVAKKDNKQQINVDSDGSYSFSYATPDQWREESVDSAGHVKGRFSFIAQGSNKHKDHYEVPPRKISISQDFNLPFIYTPQALESVPIPHLANLNNHNLKMNSDGSNFFSFATPHQFRAEVAQVKGHKSIHPKNKVLLQDNQKSSGGAPQNLQDGIAVTDNATPTENYGSNSYSYETTDQMRQEVGDISENVRGQYPYTADDGIRRIVHYKASPESGFTAKGSHLPLTENSFLQNGEQLSQQNQEFSGGEKLASQNLQDGIVAVNNGSPTENDGSYSYSYETSDQMRQEAGDIGGNIQGQYSYTADDGIRRTVHYKASSDKGFTAEGSHLPSNENSFFQNGEQLSQHNQEASGGEELSVSQHIQDDIVAVNNGSPIENDGSYSYSYETSDQMRQEAGDIGGNIQGQYSYTADDGIRRTVHYKASPESGFTAEGSHLPLNENLFLQNGEQLSQLNQEASGREEIPESQNLQDDIVAVNNDGSYSYSYETSDQMRQEAGDIGGNVQGQYSYIAGDGIRRTVHYKASPGTGFTVEGSHLPLTESNVNTKSIISNPQEIKVRVASSSNILEKASSDEIIPPVDSVKIQENSDSRDKTVRYGDINSLPRAEHTSHGYANIIPTADFISHMPEDSPQVILDLSGIRRAVATKGSSSIQKHKKIIKKRPIDTTATFPKILPDGSYSFAYNTKDQLRRESVDTTGNVYSGYQYKTKDNGRTVVVFIRKRVKEPSNEDTRTAENIDQKQAKRGTPSEYDDEVRNYQHKKHTPPVRGAWLNRKRHVQEFPDPINDIPADQQPRFVQLKSQDSQVNGDLQTHSVGSDGFQNKFAGQSYPDNTEYNNHRRVKAIVKPFRGNVRHISKMNNYK